MNVQPPPAGATPNATPGAKPGESARKVEHHARRTWRLTVTLIATFGTLTIVGMLLVLGVSLWIAIVNTSNLLRDKAGSAIASLDVQISEHLSPAEDALIFLDERIRAGDLGLRNPEQLTAALTGALAAAPQIMGVGYVGPDLQSRFVSRSPDGSVRTGTPDFRDDPMVRAAIREVMKTSRPTWSAPVWRDMFVDTLLIARMPIRRDGRDVGGLVAFVQLRDLSNFLSQIAERTDVQPFILFGRDRVLAHANLSAGFKGSDAKPLPGIGEIGDPIVAHLWDPDVRRPAAVSTKPPVRTMVVAAGESPHIVFWKELRGFGPEPWLIGVHAETRVFGESLLRLAIGAGAGLLAVVLAIVAALWIGRKISRPIGRLADAAREVGEFRLEAVPPLPTSGIREINDQSQAFNSMVNGLRWFGTYVPKGLVRHLLQSGDITALESDNRNLTVMFTDIVGFSTFSEDRPAHEVAAFLNEHFEIMTRCIEQEGGTVDKFIGDSVMAFWGAPDKQKARAASACRAALAMGAALGAENEARRSRGKDPVRIRVGIHSGRATVGNIGSADRLNYTVIGDMVNVAQRLEQLGKELAVAGGDATVLISEATRKDLPEGFETRLLGRHTVKGREGAVEVWELVAGPAVDAGQAAGAGPGSATATI